MKLTIPQPRLAAALSKGGAVAPKSHAAPIVTNLRLTAIDGFLLIASTDMDRFAEAKTPAGVDATGDTTVSAAALTALVGRLPKDKDVAIELEGEHLIVKCGRSRSKLPTLSPKLFPSWLDDAASVEVEMTGADLADRFGPPRPMSEPNGLTNVMLQGVHVAAQDGVMRFVATNRYMVAMVTAATDVSFAGVTVPNETVDAALRVFKSEERVVLAVSKNKVEFSNHAYRLGSKLIAETYPLAQVLGFLSAPPAGTITAPRAALIESIERARLGMDAEGVRAVVLLIPRAETDLEVKGFNSNGGEVRDGVEVDTTEGFEFAAFDPRYLLNVLSAMDGEEVEIRQCDDRIKHLIASPANPDFLGLVAAVRSNAAMAE
jgi:DNA polymerase-3 subunit beta